MTTGDRLREQREAKGLNQGALAELLGVDRKTQNNYETGKRKPTAAYLEEIAKAGLDVVYILTGRRDPKLLTEEQRRLVDMYAGLNEDRQRDLMAKALDLFIEEGRDKPRPGQRMREGKGNTVTGKLAPISKGDKR